MQTLEGIWQWCTKQKVINPAGDPLPSWETVFKERPEPFKQIQTHCYPAVVGLCFSVTLDWSLALLSRRELSPLPVTTLNVEMWTLLLSSQYCNVRTAQVKKWRKKKLQQWTFLIFLTKAHIFILAEMCFSGMLQSQKQIYCVPIYNLAEFFSIDYGALDIYVTVYLCLRN